MVMTNQEYVKNCTRTERVLDPDAQVNIALLLQVFELQKQVGDIADCLKKIIFYGLDAKEVGLVPKTMFAGREIEKTLEKIYEQIIDGKTEELPIKGDFTRHLHAILGVITESGELAEGTTKYVTCQEKMTLEEFKLNVFEELGDLSWYKGIACDYFGFDLTDIQEKNIAKLKVRFPEKFSQDQVVNRDLKAEQAALMGGANE